MTSTSLSIAALAHPGTVTFRRPLTRKEGLVVSRRLGDRLLLPTLALVVFTAFLCPEAQAAPLTVVTTTSGHEELTANLVEGELRISLKNNHRQTITAFSITIGDTEIREDLAYSEVRVGIEPGDTYETSYSVAPSPAGSEPPTLNLLVVLLKDKSTDGDAVAARGIRDERLGEKLQIHRTLKVLAKEGGLRKDPTAFKSDLVAAFNADEYHTRIGLRELQSIRSDDRLSDDVRSGLRAGREKMLERIGAVEQLPVEHRERALLELQQRASKLFAKL